jgi:hypothetical protein
LSSLRGGRTCLRKQALNLASVTVWSIESLCLMSLGRISSGNSRPPLPISTSALSSPMPAYPGEFLKLDRQLHQATLRVSTMAHLDITHHFGAKLAKRRRGAAWSSRGQWVRKTAFPVWRMTEPRRRMYTALARRFTTLDNPCCTKRCADPQSKRKQANDIAFPPSLGGHRVSGPTTPIYAIPLFCARIAVNL